jgi:hypothetical protein
MWQSRRISYHVANLSIGQCLRFQFQQQFPLKDQTLKDQNTPPKHALDPYNLRRIATGRPYSHSCRRPMTVTVFPTGVCPQREGDTGTAEMATGELLLSVDTTGLIHMFEGSCQSQRHP